MKSLEILQKFAPEKIQYDIGPILGDGADGECFSIDKDKIVKYSILYDLNYSHELEYHFKRISKVFNFIQSYNNSCVPTLFDHGLLYKGTRNTFVGEQEYIIYFSVFQKLLKLSEDEKKAMHSLFDFFSKDFSTSKVKDSLKEMSNYLDFNHPKYFEFYTNLLDLQNKMDHNDLHVRNVMKDGSGVIKLIDFDKSSLVGDVV